MRFISVRPHMRLAPCRQRSLTRESEDIFELADRLRREVKKLRDVEIQPGVETVMGPAD